MVCEVAVMRISYSKSEAKVIDWEKMVCPFQFGGQLLPLNASKEMVKIKILNNRYYVCRNCKHDGDTDEL